MTKDELKNKVLNGGRGSGQSLRLLIEVYENHIADLQHKVDTLQGFLAVLKAGRPQWHDLRKDPNDLPYMETELLCQKSSGRCFVGYYSDDNKFHSHETGKSYDIVRWMDIGIWWNIPTFDKE